MYKVITLTAPVANLTTVLTQNLNIPISIVSNTKVVSTEIDGGSSKATRLLGVKMRSGKSSTRIDLQVMRPLSQAGAVFRNKVYVTRTDTHTECRGRM